VTAAIVGSEGTFAVATELVLKLLPKPPAVQTLLAVFRDPVAGGEAVTRAIHLGARPRAGHRLVGRAASPHFPTSRCRMERARWPMP